nr:MAG TPA: hypothetical protein [Bacteriophage sp.]
MKSTGGSRSPCSYLYTAVCVRPNFCATSLRDSLRSSRISFSRSPKESVSSPCKAALAERPKRKSVDT